MGENKSGDPKGMLSFDPVEVFLASRGLSVAAFTLHPVVINIVDHHSVSWVKICHDVIHEIDFVGFAPFEKEKLENERKRLIKYYGFDVCIPLHIYDSKRICGEALAVKALKYFAEYNHYYCVANIKISSKNGYPFIIATALTSKHNDSKIIAD